MSDQTIDTKQLRELLAKVAPEPWHIDHTAFYAPGGMSIEITSHSANDADTAQFSAELVLALRNAAPALLDELDRLREVERRAKIVVSENDAFLRQAAIHDLRRTLSKDAT